MTGDADALLEPLRELIAIPSISADPAHAGEVRAAAEWVCERVRGADGGTADVVMWGDQPLAVGEVRASRDAVTAPTVLCYGHFDVQPPDPLELWDSPPFELDERDGWLYARGIADDKGQLFMLLEAAHRLAAAGELPVNVRFACDGEEETGGHSIVEFLAEDERGADAAVVFDSDMLEPGRPAFNVAVRGMCYFHITVRTGGQGPAQRHVRRRRAERDARAHAGAVGGRALERPRARAAAGGDRAAHHRGGLRLGHAAARLGRARGSRRDAYRRPRRRGVLRAHVGRALGGRPRPRRRLAEPAEDGAARAGGGERLDPPAPGQSVASIAPVFQRLVREAAPAGAEIGIEQWSSSDPGLVAPGSQALTLAADAFEETVGTRPVLIRSGGTIPLVPALSTRGIPAIVTGFALKESNVHSPNERLRADYLPLGVATAEEVLRRLGRLG